MRASLTRTVRESAGLEGGLTCREGESSPLTFLILRIVQPRLEGESNGNSAEMAVEGELLGRDYREIGKWGIE